MDKLELDAENDCLNPRSDAPNPRAGVATGQTGPRLPTGKAISSRNAIRGNAGETRETRDSHLLRMSFLVPTDAP